MLDTWSTSTHPTAFHLSTLHRNAFHQLIQELNISIPKHWYRLQYRHLRNLNISNQYNHSTFAFLKQTQPEHTFLPWKFTNTPKGTWKLKLNHVLFFQHLERKLRIKEAQEWYSHLSKSMIEKNGGWGLVQNHYKSSPIVFVKEMIPNHDWIVWKFKCVCGNFWKDISSHVSFFSWICVELNLTHPQCFYSLSLRDIYSRNGSTLVSHLYKNSPEDLVRRLNPEIEWMEWLFKGNRKWKNKENHKRFFEWMKRNLKVKKNEEWYSKMTQKNVSKLGGTSLLVLHFRDSAIAFLQKMVPNHKWIPWKFDFVCHGFWKSIDSHIFYFNWLCEEMNMTHPNKFYSIMRKDIIKRYGSSICACYGNSSERLVREINPEMKWVRWMFKGNHRWSILKNHRDLFEWIGNKMRFFEIEDWKRLQKDDFEKLNAISLIQGYYDGKVSQFISSHFKWWKNNQTLETPQKAVKVEIDDNDERREIQGKLWWIVSDLFPTSTSLKYNFISTFA